MVAIMTDLLAVSPGDRVFEVGTGCGYHAAVVAEIVGGETVYSAEYVPELADAARDRLDRLGYDVAVRAADARTAFEDRPPFDATYLTCAADGAVPAAILDRTRVGGRVVAPVETSGSTGGAGRAETRQRLVRLTVRADGVDREDHGAVRFVPMR